MPHFLFSSLCIKKFKIQNFKNKFQIISKNNFKNNFENNFKIWKIDFEVFCCSFLIVAGEFDWEKERRNRARKRRISCEERAEETQKNLKQTGERKAKNSTFFSFIKAAKCLHQLHRLLLLRLHHLRPLHRLSPSIRLLFFWKLIFLLFLLFSARRIWLKLTIGSKM